MLSFRFQTFRIICLLQSNAITCNREPKFISDKSSAHENAEIAQQSENQTKPNILLVGTKILLHGSQNSLKHLSSNGNPVASKSIDQSNSEVTDTNLQYARPADPDLVELKNKHTAEKASSLHNLHRGHIRRLDNIWEFIEVKEISNMQALGNPRCYKSCANLNKDKKQELKNCGEDKKQNDEKVYNDGDKIGTFHTNASDFRKKCSSESALRLGETTKTEAEEIVSKSHYNVFGCAICMVYLVYIEEDGKITIGKTENLKNAGDVLNIYSEKEKDKLRKIIENKSRGSLIRRNLSFYVRKFCKKIDSITTKAKNAHDHNQNSHKIPALNNYVEQDMFSRYDIGKMKSKASYTANGVRINKTFRCPHDHDCHLVPTTTV